MSKPENKTISRIETINQNIATGFSFPVIFTRDCFNTSNTALSGILSSLVKDAKIMAFLDSGLVEAWPAVISMMEAYLDFYGYSLAGPPHLMPGGEPVKDGWKYATEAMDLIAKNGLCRHSYVLAIGGGAFLDTVGLSAALIHRGIRLIRFPSTTLSQDDSGIGVKNGINLDGQKNLVGTFAPPHAVINDLSFLKTLPQDIMMDGISEAFKVAIIKDAGFFEFLVEAAEGLSLGQSELVEEAVKRCCVIHLDHIENSGDPFELGHARPLDFGHWSAHRLEAMSNYEIRHGQAVAIGIALDSAIACQMEYITALERDLIVKTLALCGLPVWHDLLETTDEGGTLEVLAGLEQFRQHIGGQLNLTLPNGIGNSLEIQHIDKDTIIDCLDWLKLHANPQSS